MPKITLVTGGAGYIGSVLIPILIKKGKKVRVFDKFYFGQESLNQVKNKIEMVQGDIRNLKPDVLKDVKEVIHLAALSNDPTAEYNPKANRQINTLGTINLAKKCKQSGIKRFVFASSCSVYYTDQPDQNIKKEDDRIKPTVPYSASKYSAEQALLKLADKNFCPVILRKGTVFGLSPRMRYDLVINTFTKDAFDKGHLTIHAGGRMWRPLVHIKDAANAYLTALEAPEKKVKAQIFNVVGGNYQVINLAQQVKSALARKGIKINLEVQEVGVPRSYRVSGQKFKKVLAWQPKYNIGQAVDEIWQDLSQGKDYNDPVFYNIRWMELLDQMSQRLKSIGRVF